MWTDDDQTTQSIARGVGGSFGTPAWPSEWPKLFDGSYRLSPPNSTFRHWHLRPVGRPGGRYYFAIMSSYEFMPTDWNFYQPMSGLLSLPYAMAIAVDIPKTYDRNDAISSVEGTLLATRVHLATSTQEDSKSSKKFGDCRLTLEQLNQGDLLHEVQIVIAVAAPDKEALKRAVDDVVNRTKPYFRLRHDVGVQQLAVAQYFSPTPTKKITGTDSNWQMVSRELAMLFAPVGYRKLSGLDGTLRGQSADGLYPFFFNSWGKEKKATHEIWVGLTGSGKTFGLNVFLTRQYVEEGVAFDLLEPMGHGGILAKALNVPWFVPSPQSTKFNLLDIMYDKATAQVTHVIRLIETILGRTFAGDQTTNHEKGLIGQALSKLYNLSDTDDNIKFISPEKTPIIEDLCNFLYQMNNSNPHIRQLGRGIADELGGLCTGSGPYAKFVNARTNLDLSSRGKATPRIFSFHEMSDDPELLAITYTQVLAAINRDSLADETPRTIAVDEVYRLMRHPSLLDFLILAVKTFRTRRKKVIVIDQQMSIFCDNEKARLIFENCPIRVIFNQRSGMQVFKEDIAFNHLTQQHLDIIRDLKRGYYLLDIEGYGAFYLNATPSASEFARYGST